MVGPQPQRSHPARGRFHPGDGGRPGGIVRGAASAHHVHHLQHHLHHSEGAHPCARPKSYLLVILQLLQVTVLSQNVTEAEHGNTETYPAVLEAPFCALQSPKLLAFHVLTFLVGCENSALFAACHCCNLTTHSNIME